jgi:hypothetical protein
VKEKSENKLNNMEEQKKRNEGGRREGAEGEKVEGI